MRASRGRSAASAVARSKVSPKTSRCRNRRSLAQSRQPAALFLIIRRKADVHSNYTQNYLNWRKVKPKEVKPKEVKPKEVKPSDL